MTDLANLLTLAAAARENADECPDCADNYWELHDALDPTTVTDLVTRLQAAEAALATLKELARPTCRNCGQEWAVWACGFSHAAVRQMLGIEWDGVEPGLAGGRP